MKHKLWNPGLVLFLLSPAIGELLMGSNPPLSFFNPQVFVLLAFLYGGGANLVRELNHRWDKGWLSLLVLGAAFAVVNEALAAKTFFNPSLGDQDLFENYGRLLGVNWVLALQLTIHHVVVSIAVPIALVELLFPVQRAKPWIGPRTFGLLCGLLAIDVVVFLISDSYKPPILQYSLAFVAIAGICALARWLPKTLLSAKKRPVARPRTLYLVSLIAFTVYFIVIGNVLPQDAPPLVTALASVGLVLIVIWLLTRLGIGNSLDIHRLALVSGVVTFLIVLAVVQEALGKLGMSTVALAATIFLLRLRRQVRLRGSP